MVEHFFSGWLKLVFGDNFGIMVEKKVLKNLYSYKWKTSSILSKCGISP